MWLSPVTLFFLTWIATTTSSTLKAEQVVSFAEDVQCRTPNMFRDGCTPSSCKRRVLDGLFTEDDILRLKDITVKGMETRKNVGGPTILDINTGFVRDSLGLDNLFTKSNDIFSSTDFDHYAKIITRLKEAVMETFDLKELFFTAPTFVTRIDADQDWHPSEIHDEYWHIHSDHNNTEHYHYSGLLYLSSYEEDFTGGRLLFFDPDMVGSEEIKDNSATLIVEPRRGRVTIFTSGPENPHRVENVLSGQRFVLSFWFTCEAQKEFEIFLDGKAHVAFSKRIAKALTRQSEL